MEDRNLFLLQDRQKRVDSSLKVRQSIVDGESVELPEVAPPPLVALDVKVAPPPDITEARVEEALIAMMTAHAETASRLRGPAEPGDVVTCDIIAFDDGKVVPFTAHLGVEVELTLDYEFPDLAEALVGAMVDEARNTVVNVPADHVNPRIAGRALVFAAQVKAIRERRLPSPEDPKFLARVGAGSVDELMAAIVEAIANATRSEWLEDVKQAVLRAYLATTPAFEVPIGLIGGRIRDLWVDNERPALESWGFGNDELNAALLAWATDKRYFDEVGEGLAIELMLDAVAAHFEPYPNDEQLVALGPAMAVELGSSEEDAQAIEQWPPLMLHYMCRSLRHRRATDYLMQLANVHVLEEGEALPSAEASSPEHVDKSDDEKAADAAWESLITKAGDVTAPAGKPRGRTFFFGNPDAT